MQHEAMSVDGDTTDSPIEIVYVRSVDGESKLTVKLIYADPVIGVRQFNFLREKAEAWEKFSQRIANNIRNGPGKKKKKSKKPKKDDKMEEEEEDESAKTKITILTPSCDPVDSNLSTDEALVADHMLCIGNVKYQVRRNSPAITNLRLSKQILLNCPVVADLDTEFCDLKDCRLEWFLATSENGEWTPLTAKGLTVTFTDDVDIGKWVKVVAVPHDSDGNVCGLEQVFVSKKPIIAGPTSTTPIRRRLDATTHRVGYRAIRVVSYNVLAEFYADSDHSREYLYPYCPPEFLEADYRRQLILWELLGYNADIFCLQEVDQKLYYRYLQPVLQSEFDCRFLPKLQCTEGVAIFYRRDKFEFVEDCSLPSLTQGLYHMEEDPEMTALVEKVKNTDKFRERWKNLRQGLIALVLRCRETESQLLVASSHLYFHPNADHMRLLQGIVCLKHLARQKKRLGPKCGILFGGDFNSDPRNVIYEMVSTGRLRSTASDWYSCGREEYVGSPQLNFGLSLSSAYNIKDIEVTNYVAGYRSILDYIFYDADCLQLSRTISLPPIEDIFAKIALPNEDYPSDHLALVSDFLLV